MKKTIFIFTAFIFCLSFTALSQKTRVGVTGGISFANISRTISGLDKDGEYRIGLVGGLQLEVPLCKKGNFSFQPDMHYIQKGAAQISTTPTFNKIYTALRYAELFTNFVYNFNSKKGTFYLGGGPYLGLPLPSKNVSHASGAPNIETDISFGNAFANDLKGVDYGGNVVMGYRIANGIFVSVNYIQGLRNLIPEPSLSLIKDRSFIDEFFGSFNPTGDKIKNIAFAIRVGYLFKNSSK